MPANILEKSDSELLKESKLKKANGENNPNKDIKDKADLEYQIRCYEESCDISNFIDSHLHELNNDTRVKFSTL